MTNLPEGLRLEFYENLATENPVLLKEMGKLRWRVWEKLGLDMSDSLDSEGWLDRLDSEAGHWIISDNDEQPVAVARFTWHEDVSTIGAQYFYENVKDLVPPIAIIGRMVVDEKYRGQGLSKILDTLAIERARAKGASCIACDVPDWRIESLKKIGYHLAQEPALGRRSPSIRWALMVMPLK